MFASLSWVPKTITGNSSPHGRGAVHYAFNSYPQQGVNNIIVLNSGGGISRQAPGDYLLYNDVWGNFNGENYIACEPGTGDISCEPEFCDTTNDNYYLFSTSCCVGEGQNGEDMGAFGVGCWSYVCGDANGDGIINVGDVVYLVSYLYRNGPAPSPVEVGDCNCDGIVNLGDIVYLVNYLYKNGPSPGCP